ncbi:diguanylate cyclase [Vibrio sp. 404]|uniref:diguanylate cyclase n=1 Tax=Vibrio marinisediminis TaxID=2758441 RepID=A0A7W2IS26_9VIBR|nr:diguanylate cyclase [Vibrio marinisediminis]MBA5761046.1 diguanylate cyclase [Vibrio marinisediminis]
MLYLAYVQLQTSEQNAHSQSLANLNTAAHLVSSQVEAASSKLFLLDDAQSLTEFDNTAKRILKHSPIYADIVHVNLETGQYRSALLNPTTAEKDSDIVWTPLIKFSPHIAISSLYEKSPGYWVFAVRYIPNASEQLWLEFDLKHATQSLRGLRTLDEGYVFVIDKHTGRLIFHPDPNRIGTPSISYHSGISELVESGTKFAEYEYYYRDQFKVSVFDADNGFDWVFISGTDRSDILAASYQFGLAAVFIVSLLYLAIAISYLTKQLSLALAELNGQSDLAGFKHQLRYTLDRFIPHQGIQFCLYNSQHGHYSTLDFHGNGRVVMEDKALANRFSAGKISYLSKSDADPLAQKLQIHSNHYVIPLHSQGDLIAIIYIQAWLPSCGSILRMIRNYTEVALSNLLLRKKLLRIDVMTKLDSQHTMNASIDCHQNSDHVFFAQLEIDFFEQILNHHGTQCADKIILATAELMQICFPKPRAISLSRDGLNKFCILFHAHDADDALNKCEELRVLVEKNPVKLGEISIPYTVSIGGGVVESAHQETLNTVEKALYKAKGAGRNQVSFNAYNS